MLSVILFSVGGHLYAETGKINEVVTRYDSEGDCGADSRSITSSCKVTFTVEEDIVGPVYVYYELDNFY